MLAPAVPKLFQFFGPAFQSSWPHVTQLHRVVPFPWHQGTAEISYQGGSAPFSVSSALYWSPWIVIPKHRLFLVNNNEEKHTAGNTFQSPCCLQRESHRKTALPASCDLESPDKALGDDQRFSCDSHFCKWHGCWASGALVSGWAV